MTLTFPPGLTSGGAITALEAEALSAREAAIARSRADPVAFAEEFCELVTPAGDRVPWKPTPEQRAALESYRDHPEEWLAAVAALRRYPTWPEGLPALKTTLPPELLDPDRWRLVLP